MGQSITQVDAFTNRPFAGNPAAVCVLTAPREDLWMQAVAAEMNLSETAYLLREKESDPETDAKVFRLRWFTPEVEVDLCGHATLASAHVLWTEGHLPLDSPALFNTRSGRLTARRRDDWIELDFPCTPVSTEKPADPALFSALLNVPVVNAAYSTFDALAEVESEEVLLGLRPDFVQLGALPIRGLIVTARASRPGFDFVSRFFAPAVGINEDPVCGSAHCCLGPYWGERLGKTDLLAFQASRRGGVVRIGLRGKRVTLAGQAVSVLKGELLDARR